MSNARATGGVIGPTSPLNPVIAIGDSITLGAPDLIGGYRSALLALAPSIVYTGRLFSAGWHEGYNGFDIPNITTQVLPTNGTPYPRVVGAKVLLVMAGLNDIALDGVSHTTALSRLKTFVDNLLACSPTITHILVSDVPDAHLYAEVPAFNSGIPGTFTGDDSRIVPVQTCNTLIVPTDFELTSHPTTGGYAKIAANFYTALKAIFPGI